MDYRLLGVLILLSIFVESHQLGKVLLDAQASTRGMVRKGSSFLDSKDAKHGRRTVQVEGEERTNQRRKLTRATPVIDERRYIAEDEKPAVDGRTIQVEDEKTVTPNNQRVFCDPRRRVWYDSDGKATIPMAGVDKLNAKVVEGPLQTGEKNSLTICLFQNKIIFEEFIRLINMELPHTLEGKCYLGCLLYQNNIMNKNYKPKPYVHSSLAATLGSFLVGIMKTFGSSFIFSGDPQIYKDVDLNKYMESAKNIGIDCLRAMEERAKQDKQTKARESKENKHVIVSKEAKQAREDAEHIENCNRMYEYMKCATNHKDFNSLKKTSLEINKLKLTNKKRVIETQSQASSSKKSTTKLPATYAEYCR